MRTRKWLAIAGDVLNEDVFEWEDGIGHFGRCLRVKRNELKKKASKLYNHVVLIIGYYPKNSEKSGKLGVLIDIRQATLKDYGKYYCMISEDSVRDIDNFKCRLEEDSPRFSEQTKA